MSDMFYCEEEGEQALEAILQDNIATVTELLASKEQTELCKARLFLENSLSTYDNSSSLIHRYAQGRMLHMVALQIGLDFPEELDELKKLWQSNLLRHAMLSLRHANTAEWGSVDVTKVTESLLEILSHVAVDTTSWNGGELSLFLAALEQQAGRLDESDAWLHDLVRFIQQQHSGDDTGGNDVASFEGEEQGPGEQVSGQISLLVWDQRLCQSLQSI